MGLSYLEVALLIRQSGGTYAYWYEAFGPIPAFLVCWFWSVIDGPAGCVIVGLTFAQYAAAPFYPGCYPPQLLIKVMAFGSILFLSVINGLSVKASNYIQIFTMASKFIVLAVIGIAGIYNIAIGQYGSLENAFEGSSTSPGAYGVAFYTCMWSYGGWERIFQCFDELKNPSKNAPIILAVSITMTAVLYIIVNVAYFTVMTPSEFLTSSAVAVTFADRMFGSWSWIVPVGIALSTLGSLNGICWAYARIPFVGARKKQLPAHLGLISVERKTPIIGQIWLFIISSLMILPDSATFSTLIDYVSPFTWIIACGVLISIIVFRFTKKDKREFKVPLIIPFIAFCLSFASIFIPIITQPNLAYLYCALVMLSGYIIYIPFFYFDVQFPGSKWVYKYMQMFFECVPNDYKDFDE